MALLKNSPIKDRVMKAITAHIENAEKEYKNMCDDIDKKAIDSKLVLADEMVNKIIGKII